jgi:molybdenum cofactor synthesis domain-containing protein
MLSWIDLLKAGERRVIRVGILTASTLGARGEREDTSGAAIRELIATIGGSVDAYRVVADDRETIAATLRGWSDVDGLDLILTTGGTGVSPTDVTPEATRDVIDRDVPGLAEAMRLEGLKYTSRAMLSRGMAGTRHRTLIVNLPGSPKGVRESLGAILDVLPHAVEILQHRPTDH